MKRPNALIIFAKSPENGDVKTRLGPRLSRAERAALYSRLLSATVAKLRDIDGVDTYIAYTPPEGAGYFGRFGLAGFAQSGGDLGARMHNALGRTLGEGHEKAVLVGADIPALSARTVQRALGLLEENDVVFGPARDGGYYLVALKRPAAEIFTGIRWSTPVTLRLSVGKAEAAGLRVGLTEELSDIDTPEDLGRLSGGGP